MTLSAAPDDETEAPLDDLKSRLVNVDPLLFGESDESEIQKKVTK